VVVPVFDPLMVIETPDKGWPLAASVTFPVTDLFWANAPGIRQENASSSGMMILILWGFGFGYKLVWQAGQGYPPDERDPETICLGLSSAVRREQIPALEVRR
jgi:hypothetical protein